METLRFADLRIGDQLAPVECEITQEAIDVNAVASLDFNPVHLDLDWCESKRVFDVPQPVAHGMMTLSLMASVVTRPWARHGALVTRLDAKFVKAVPAGDALRCVGFVKEIHPVGAARNFVVVDLKALNRAGETVAAGSARVRIPD